jgi:hypothetical protein
MSGMHPRHVAQKLAILEWIRVCSKVDEMVGEPDSKFEVLHIVRREGAVTVTISAKNNRLIHIDLINGASKNASIEVQAEKVA